MREQDLIDLGFTCHEETIESSGADNDWHYYTMDIEDICLISNSSDDIDDNEWQVELFDYTCCVIKELSDLENLIGIIKKTLSNEFKENKAGV